MIPKFKVWDKSSNRMGIVKNLFGVFSGNFSYVDVCFSTKYPRKNLSIGHVILLQYSGINDNKGSEIYVGDILKSPEHLWVVSFNDRGCFVAYDPKDTLNWVLLDDYEFEVIGNIYEDSKLID